MKAKQFLLFIILCFCLNNIVNSQNLDSIVQQANKLYTANEFNEAIDIYQQVIDSGYIAAELYYNLGNAYYRIGRLGLAIASYEKAKLLKPNDKDVEYNLSLARSHIVDEIEVIPDFFLKRWLYYLINSQSSNFWSILSISLFIVSLIVLLTYLLSKRLLIKKLFFSFFVLCFIISTSSFYFASKRKQILQNPGIAIIAKPLVTLKSAPNEYGKNSFSLHEGTKVQILNSEHEWKEVKLSNGKRGWIKSRDIIEL